MEFLGFSQQDWIQIGISLGIVVAALVIARPVLSFILDRIIKRLTGITSSNVDDIVLEAVRKPLYWLVFVLAFKVAYNRLAHLFETNLENLYSSLYIIIGFVAIWRLINALAKWYGDEVAPKTGSTLDNQLIPFFRRIVLIILSVITAIILLGYFNIEVSGLVATLGVGSLAIALAAQAALSDTISGFMIMIDRPFRIGDRIEIQDLSTWGDVIDIGLRSTRIRTRDNRMVIVPNSVISKSLIVNHSYPDTQYRIQIEIGVAYGTDLEFARKTIIDTVRGVEGVLPDRKVEALFLRFGDSAHIFRIRWWLESYVDTRRMFDRVNTALYNALNEAGIEMPFPSQEVYHKIDSEDVPQFIEVFRGKK